MYTLYDGIKVAFVLSLYPKHSLVNNDKGHLTIQILSN